LWTWITRPASSASFCSSSFHYGRRTRERIWDEVKGSIEEGNAVLAWTAPNDAGFAFETCGENRRVPVDVDGFTLVAFNPPPAAGVT
jgi:CRISPR-associated protein Cas2